MAAMGDRAPRMPWLAFVIYVAAIAGLALWILYRLVWVL